MSERQTEMIEAYLKPWRRGASRLKFASVVENFEFIPAVPDDLPSDSAGRLSAPKRAGSRTSDRYS
jgi:hypothetical protein